MNHPRSRIQGVDRLLSETATEGLVDEYSRSRVVEALREVVARARARVGAGEWEGDPAEPVPYLRSAEGCLRDDTRPSLRPVLNATGVVLHTNLGRAPLAPEAILAVGRVAHGYSNLEYGLGEGGRGSRYQHCAGLLQELTGAEAGLVVNNCAAGLVLGLAALARGRDVLVSRGELVEIGGGFRIPDMLRQAGARLREVGSTNRCRVEDYDAAYRAGGVGAILKVHRSNFRISGFTEEAELGGLAAWARERELPLLYDLGSGLMVDPIRLGLPPEPRPWEAIEKGTDLVVFSGDKLLGGPQAGLVIGTARAVGSLKSHPLCRAFRVDKGTLSALEATLRLYRDPDEALRSIPVLKSLATRQDDLMQRCEALAEELVARVGAHASIGTGERQGRVGGGTYPGHVVPSWGVSVRPANGNLDEFARLLRNGSIPVVGRIEDDAWWMDLRAIDPSEDPALLKALQAALKEV